MSLHPRARATRWLVGVAACSTLILPALGNSAGADEIPAIQPQVFASVPAGATKPDDITRRGNALYVTYQNNASKDGTPPGATSTVVAFDRSTAKVLTTYVLTGRCDGLTADPKHGRIFATVNEDLNSSLYVITPQASTRCSITTTTQAPRKPGRTGPPTAGPTPSPSAPTARSTSPTRIRSRHSQATTTPPPSIRSSSTAARPN
jgi:hypothetical protein